MAVTRRLLLVPLVTVAYWLLVLCNPLQFVIADLMQPGANDSGYSPYSASERCDAVRLHIPAGHCGRL